MEKEKQKKLLNQITETVRACGEIILHADRSKNCIDAKTGHANFVTTYDKKVQKELQKRFLKFYRRRFLSVRRKIFMLPLLKATLLL